MFKFSGQFGDDDVVVVQWCLVKAVRMIFLFVKLVAELDYIMR